MYQRIVRIILGIGLLVSSAAVSPQTEAAPSGWGGGGGLPTVGGIVIIREDGQCFTASNPYCEVCYCTRGRTGKGSECWSDAKQTGPSGEPCIYCAAVGTCPNSFGGFWGWF